MERPSGDQLGEVSSESPVVICCWPDPSALATTILGTCPPFEFSTKRSQSSRLPSADHRGICSVAGLLLTSTVPLASATMMSPAPTVLSEYASFPLDPG